MKTRDLVTRLAGDISPVERNAVPMLLNRALMLGLAGSTVLLVALYGVRSDMPDLILTTMFWVRLVFPLAIIAAAMKLAERLGRPGAPLKFAWFAVALPIVTMLLATGGILMATPPGYRLQLMLGTTWRTTTASVVMLSFPSLTAMMHAMKQLAPTRLALAGAGAGLLAGAQGLLVYSLYCSEMAVPFWGVWYVLAIAITTAIGAAIAPHCLRW
ncbi:DUF1109 domain-containing protein [Paraburkholderia sp. LEh10]|uniref:DUF1109 domain-containing protein n=1 Tax=Paraburkholderia sp. LEh10 TaxID=2821353 RepID=UPI001AE1A100|nr:DUF1109 domain-containing protein [Paraburkholderia sp. LEh10]MBP0595928.1 DUF1109 domain-containing protein [Paraburkholderia sp. LEh10]